jgi:hypothetical protein
MIDSVLPKVLAVIPARGGSKRLPRKNIKKNEWPSYGSSFYYDCS